MKKILFTALAAALIAACTTPQTKKTANGKDGKAGSSSDAADAAPLPPGVEVTEASLRGSGFDVDLDIKPVRFDYDSAQLSTESLAVLKGSDPDITTDYGLPNPLYGLEVIVEDSPIVTELPNSAGTVATTNRSFIYPSTVANIVSRVGGVDGNYGSPTASTLQRYYYKYDMTVETFDNPKHKLFETYCVDQYKEVLAAQRAGYLITAAA